MLIHFYQFKVVFIFERLSLETEIISDIYIYEVVYGRVTGNIYTNEMGLKSSSSSVYRPSAAVSSPGCNHGYGR
jgi:hypothetical protein